MTKPEPAHRKLVDYDRRPFGQDGSTVPLISGEGARGYYRVGYLDAARDAARNLLERAGDNRSAMPVLFLLRHYVELALKDLVAAAGAFAIELADKRFGHDLAALWVEAGKVLDNFGIKKTAIHDALVAELVELDARADAFRYALDRRDQRQFDRIGSVDLSAVRVGIDTISKLLEKALDRLEREEAEMDEMIADAVARDPY